MSPCEAPTSRFVCRVQLLEVHLRGGDCPTDAYPGLDVGGDFLHALANGSVRRLLPLRCLIRGEAHLLGKFGDLLLELDVLGRKVTVGLDQLARVAGEFLMDGHAG